MNDNGVFDAGTDTGINGVALTLFADDGDGVFDAGDTQIATTTTAGGGLYSFTGLAPGNYIVRVDQSNFDRRRGARRHAALGHQHGRSRQQRRQ